MYKVHIVCEQQRTLNTIVFTQIFLRFSYGFYSLPRQTHTRCLHEQHFTRLKRSIFLSSTLPQIHTHQNHPLQNFMAIMERKFQQIYQLLRLYTKKFWLLCNFVASWLQHNSFVVVILLVGDASAELFIYLLFGTILAFHCNMGLNNSDTFKNAFACVCLHCLRAKKKKKRLSRLPSMGARMSFTARSLYLLLVLCV